MKTKLLKEKDIEKAAHILKKGGVVAFPTETVYGLGANALDKKATNKIFIAKGRPKDNPMIVHISGKKELYKIARKIPEKAKKLMEKYWPGPLTIILKKNKLIPCEVTAGLDTVAIRYPKHKIAQKLIKTSGFPIAAPSANKSGRPSPTEAKHVMEDLMGKIDAIIESGPTKHGLESTVIDLTVDPPQILRPGAITKEEITKTIGKLQEKKTKKIKSPGMKYRHYAPKTKIILSDTKQILRIMDKHKGKKISLLSKTKKGNPAEFIKIGKTKKEIAKNLYKNLRLLDEKKTDIILVEKTDEKGIGNAIMNRLKKAAR
jgi:L-threonylcarbamoyladenylate synthase